MLNIFFTAMLAAEASVASIPVTKDTLAQQAGERITVQCTPSTQHTTLRVRLRPPAGEVFVYAMLHTAPPDQPGWSGKLATELLEDGRLQVTVTARRGAPGTTLDVLLDNALPDRPAVGWLYRLDLDTFRC